ncbi:MAG TPA: SDR family NAD(P)-dependent oxidoreductase [Myxococcota bacterium]|nr:SDR family NAD(P)-dependent oxidoreductase [Myxococcota bacterium]
MRESRLPAFETAIVVGASSGIGEALVRKLAAEGTKVAALARRESELQALAKSFEGRVVPYVHDVRNFAEAPVLFDRIKAELGSVDLLVYNAGVMPRVEESEYNFEKNRQMVEVNLIGAMAWMDPAAAYMEARRAGTLCGISSVAGDRGRRGNPGYHASKAGFTTYLESLRNRLTHRGVRVVTVKPGPVKTAMTDGLKMPLMISAEECADGVLSLAKASTTEGYVPAAWGPIMFAIRSIPSVLFRRTSI